MRRLEKQCGSESWARAPAAVSRSGTAIAPIAARCAPARRDFRPRTQSSLAVSADGANWVLLNASPDLREQIAAAPQLAPAEGDRVRASPIKAVALTNGDVDHVAGLLNLREAQPFSVYAAGPRARCARRQSDFHDPRSRNSCRASNCRWTRAIPLHGAGVDLGLVDPRLSRAGQDRALSRRQERAQFRHQRRRHARARNHRDEDGQILLLHSRLREGRRRARRASARRRARVLRRHAVPRERDDRAGPASARPARAWAMST